MNTFTRHCTVTQTTVIKKNKNITETQIVCYKKNCIYKKLYWPKHGNEQKMITMLTIEFDLQDT